MKNIISPIITMFLFAGTINHLHAQEKSTALALGLSVVPSVVGCHYGLHNGLFPTVLASFFVAPSLGHFYAGQWKIGLTFIASRSLIMAGSIFLLSGSNDMDMKIGTYFLTFCTCCAISLVDWIMIPFSVREYNERFQIKPEIDLQNGSYGLGISYNF